jgi:hypothetical protein
LESQTIAQDRATLPDNRKQHQIILAHLLSGWTQIADKNSD